MGKKSTSEKLNSPDPSPKQSIFASLSAADWKETAFPLFLIIGALIVISVSIIPWSNNLPSDSPLPFIKKGSGFIQQTQSWTGKTLILNADNFSLDISSEIGTWQNRTLFSYHQRAKTPKLTRQSLNQIIFTQLKVINPWCAFSENTSVWGFDLDAKKIYNKLSTAVAPQIERKAQNATLDINNGRAIRFQPDITGRSVDVSQATLTIQKAFFLNQSIVSLPLITTQPELRLHNTNNLGIEELIARGESDFTGSSANRIQNIRVGASRFNGLILGPGEEFSFNKNLGRVTAEDGFRPEIVIKSTGQVPELGGGICQVSTTAFRAALYGGLPITARKNHSFAVKYYAPQGTDATVYPGAVDLKFINDTPAHLLIATRVEDKKLIFEFFGTHDGRQVTIDGPYQYDRGPGGAMKARLTRTITKGELPASQEFYSRYVSVNLFPKLYEYPKPLPAPTPPVTESPQTPPPDGLKPDEQNPTNSSPVN